MSRIKSPLSISELFGLYPYDRALSQAKLALLGDKDSPRSRWGLSSLRQYRPALSVGLYLGRPFRPRTAVITNLFNHRQPPPEQGWSVTVTNVEDFRGGTLTYDSHNGTDFSIPPGSTVVAAAPGVVTRVSSEFHRGGLKVFIDHGDGLLTSCNHLGRALVKTGQRVARGEPIAISGYSGIDAVAGFPFTPPHIHFNVFLNGVHVDPFPRGEESSLWRSGDLPTPCPPGTFDEPAMEPTDWDMDQIQAMASDLKRTDIVQELELCPTVEQMGTTLMYYMSIYPRLFPRKSSLMAKPYPRRPTLDLPLSHREYDGVCFWES